MAKPLVHAPNAVLTTNAKPVTKFDAKLHALIRDMKASLKAATKPAGVGLAAPQIGISMRVFITKPTKSSPMRTFINPKIVQTSKETVDGLPDRESALEGCLSIPNVWGKVRRHTEVTLAYQDEHGGKHKETFEGFEAIIIQHETDHINGILYTQRVLEQKSKLYTSVTDEDGKDALEELEL